MAAAAVAACGSAAVAGTALAAAVKGGHYRGTTATGTRVELRVSRNGKRLATYLFRATTTCTNRESGSVFFRSARNSPVIHIHRNGFSLSTTLNATIFDRRTNRSVPGRYTDTVSGRFDSRRNVTGTVRIRFRSRSGSIRCDSRRVSYSAHAA